MKLEGLSIDRYVLERLLGRGSMGEVYLAHDTTIHRQVAIKIVRTEHSPYPNSEAAKIVTDRSQREMKAIAVLDHPHILPLFDYGEKDVDGDVFAYIVMPYREEGSFAQWLRRRKSEELLTTEDVVFFMQQAAQALQHAHEHNIIHQDVKPSNFLIRSHTTAPDHPDLYLADFGIAKFISATSSTSQDVRGTPTYMAPEQWEGQAVPATDQYALATMTYELLTGQTPFQGNMAQLMYQHLHTKPDPPGKFNPDLSPHVDAVLLSALAKDPAERFPSVIAFISALQQALQNVDPALLKRETTKGTSPAMTNALDRHTPVSPGVSGKKDDRHDLIVVEAMRQTEDIPSKQKEIHQDGIVRQTEDIPSGLIAEQKEVRQKAVLGNGEDRVPKVSTEKEAVYQKSDFSTHTDTASKLARTQLNDKAILRSRRVRLMAIVACVVVIIAGSSILFYQVRSLARSSRISTNTSTNTQNTGAIEATNNAMSTNQANAQATTQAQGEANAQATAQAQGQANAQATTQAQNQANAQAATATASAITPFQVIGATVSASPNPITGICGNPLTITYSVVITAPANSPGGDAYYTLFFNGGSSGSYVMHFSAGQTSGQANFTSTIQVKYPAASGIPAISVVVTSPDRVSSNTAQPMSGLCAYT